MAVVELRVLPPPPSPPTRLDEYFQYFMPFIVTALLPTAISSQWRKIDSHRLTRDEQTWLSTTYVQIYAFLQVGVVEQVLWLVTRSGGVRVEGF